MIVVQISDLHVTEPGELAYGRVDTNACLQRAVDHLNSLAPQPVAVVATGDLVDNGLPQEYAELRNLLEDLRAPIYLSPGNHDDRNALRAEFADHYYLQTVPDFVQYTIACPPIRLICLDSTIPGEHGGALCETRLGWLEKTLGAAPFQPTVIVMHHPPFMTGIDAMDAIGLGDPRPFEELIASHANVLGVWCGHLHRATTCRWAGTVATTCPSTAHQVALDLQPSAPLSFAMERAGYQLHQFRVTNAGVALVTHTAVFPSGERPFRPLTG